MVRGRLEIGDWGTFVGLRLGVRLLPARAGRRGGCVDVLRLNGLLCDNGHAADVALPIIGIV